MCVLGIMPWDHEAQRAFKRGVLNIMQMNDALHRLFDEGHAVLLPRDMALYVHEFEIFLMEIKSGKPWTLMELLFEKLARVIGRENAHQLYIAQYVDPPIKPIWSFWRSLPLLFDAICEILQVEDKDWSLAAHPDVRWALYIKRRFPVRSGAGLAAALRHWPEGKPRADVQARLRLSMLLVWQELRQRRPSCGRSDGREA